MLVYTVIKKDALKRIPGDIMFYTKTLLKN